MSDYIVCFSSYEGHKDGWMLARAPASPAQDFHHHEPLGIPFFLIFVRCVALSNLDLLIKTDRSVICPLCC